MKPLTIFSAWVFFLFTLWGGSLSSQNLNAIREKNIEELISDSLRFIAVTNHTNPVPAINFSNDTTNQAFSTNNSELLSNI